MCHSRGLNSRNNKSLRECEPRQKVKFKNITLYEVMKLTKKQCFIKITLHLSYEKFTISNCIDLQSKNDCSSKITNAAFVFHEN